MDSLRLFNRPVISFEEAVGGFFPQALPSLRGKRAYNLW